MKIVDVNVLIYATNAATHLHHIAKEWLDRAMQDSATIALPTMVTVAYVRLVTNARVMAQPLPVAHATTIVEQWLTRPNVTVPSPTTRHYAIMAELLDVTGVGGNLVSDAHLGALAIEHGAELWSFDNDFDRFPGLRWRRPGSDR